MISLKGVRGIRILAIGMALLVCAMALSVVSMLRESLLALSIPAAILAIVSAGICGLGLYKFFEEIKSKKRE